MAIELRQQLKLSQQLVMTPQLQQAIKLLQLSRLELVDMIQQEMEINPALEESIDHTIEELTPEEQELIKPEPLHTEEVKIDEKIKNDTDWENYIDEYNSAGRSQFEFEGKEAPKYESFIASKQSLEDHLLWQLLMAMPSPEEEEIGSQIIGNLNKDGYLTSSVEEIAEASGKTLDQVEDVLFLLQSFDPVGVCARDLSECLLIQAKYLGLKDKIVIEIIKSHITHLENKNYKAISKALKISLKAVITAVNIIQGFEPKPGRPFNDDEPHYIVPDIYVYKHENKYVIMLNDDGVPRLRINPYYKKAISRGETIPSQTKNYLQEKMRSATWLIKSIHQRQKTIYNVMESIVKFQKDFFDKGIAYLKPMVLRDMAQDINMHESTVSRVTTNKYAYTPQGIFELKYFFNSSINRIHGSAIASASVMEKIKRIIDSEDPKRPYSDEKLVEILKESNIDIARRTIAKYREIMRVLPSNKRKQY
jgi:RNA polymerase sigma-54 factor